VLMGCEGWWEGESVGYNWSMLSNLNMQSNLNMLSNLKLLVKISRPRFWWYLGGPFIVGYTAGVYSWFGFQNVVMYGYWLYFLILANVFLYGINDLNDQDTDKLNAKKDEKEHRLGEDEEYLVESAVVGSAFVGLIMALVSGELVVMVAMVAFLVLGYFYSARPVRLKVRVVVDGLSNVLFVLPAVAGYGLSTGEWPNWALVGVAGVWSVGMHLWSAIVDIEADRAAGLRTTAVALGEKWAHVMVLLLWLGAWVWWWMVMGGEWIVWLGLVYPMLALGAVVKIPVARMYWGFAVINVVFGVLLFGYVLVERLRIFW
jgi:4-hydroxybenzoate polyprenyltransferase